MRKFKIESAPSEGSLHQINIICKAKVGHYDYLVLSELNSQEVEDLMSILGNALKTMKAIEQSPALRSK